MPVPNGTPIIGGDLPAYNAAVTAIPAFTAVVFDTSNPPTGDQPMSVKIITAAGSVAAPAGVTVQAIPAGATGLVRRYGTVKATAHGTVAIGDFVQVSNTAGHEGQVKTSGGGVATLGQCIRGATDDEVLVALSFALNA